jgi:hypothetical protein
MAEPVLNDRQRAYLQAIFDTDQTVEAEWRAIPFSPFRDRPKASEWRWMEYSEPIPIINKPASRLYCAIKDIARIDQGTGSTFTALADRGLIQVTERGPGRYTHIRITTAGRKLMRSWTGQKAYKAPPAGTLQEWHWRALAKVYAVADAGLAGGGDGDNWIGPRTWQRLEDYKSGALVEQRRGTTPQEYWHWRYYITPAGKALYEREWARYRELYPDVDAPQPVGAAERALP